MARRRSIEREARDQRIYQLAASGLTYAEIGEQVRLTKGRISQIIKAQAAQQTEESMKVGRELALQRDMLIVRKHMANLGDHRSARIVLDANEQIARLLGLYTPQQGAGTAEAASLLDQLVNGLEDSR